MLSLSAGANESDVKGADYTMETIEDGNTAAAVISQADIEKYYAPRIRCAHGARRSAWVSLESVACARR